MKLLASILLLITSSFVFSLSFAKGPEKFYDLTANDLNGKKINFSDYQGKVVLIVNTASQCGFTPQLNDLEVIHQKYGSKGLVVLGFPSNDFKQESGVGQEIQKFASDKYKISFPLFEKGPVTGSDKQPVYKFLTDQKSGVIFKEVAWNFEKFLVSRKGEVVERWSSMTKPTSDSMIKAIEKELAVNEKH